MARVKSSRGRFLDAMVEPKDWAKIREAIRDHLFDYATGGVETFDKEIAYTLGDALRDLMDGHLPKLLDVKLDAGARRLGYGARSGIEDAVRYVAWVKAGYIDDRAPNKTVRECYGASAKRVRVWCAESYVEVPAGKPSVGEVERVKALMRFSGRHHSNQPGTLTQAAIRARAKSV